MRSIAKPTFIIHVESNTILQYHKIIFIPVCFFKRNLGYKRYETKFRKPLHRLPRWRPLVPVPLLRHQPGAPGKPSRVQVGLTGSKDQKWNDLIIINGIMYRINACDIN